MDRQVTSPKRVTSPTQGPPPPCKHALSFPRIVHSRRSRGTGGPVPGVLTLIHFIGKVTYGPPYELLQLGTLSAPLTITHSHFQIQAYCWRGLPSLNELYGSAPLQSRYPFFNERCTKGYPFLYYNGGIQKGKGFGLRGGAFVPLHVAVPLKFFSGIQSGRKLSRHNFYYKYNFSETLRIGIHNNICIN